MKIAFLFICVSSFAQTKVGTIDVDFILSKMPELATVQKQVEDYTKGLDAELQVQSAAFTQAMEAYKRDEPSLTILQRKTKQDSILVMEQDINKFRQNGVTLIGLKREEYMQPLYDKLGTALEKVAEAEGYTQILLRNNDVVYLDNNYDVTVAVLKELGIEIKQEE